MKWREEYVQQLIVLILKVQIFLQLEKSDQNSKQQIKIELSFCSITIIISSDIYSCHQINQK